MQHQAGRMCAVCVLINAVYYELLAIQSSHRPLASVCGSVHEARMQLTEACTSSGARQHVWHHLLMSHTAAIQGASQKVTEAKEQIAVCKREFQAAMRAGDVQKQRLYESWINHWHQKLAEEKRVAQKKVQPTK